MILGGLLIVAASICFLGGVLASNHETAASALTLAKLAFFFTAELCFAGVIFVCKGLAQEHKQRQADNNYERTSNPPVGQKMDLSRHVRRKGAWNN